MLSLFCKNLLFNFGDAQNFSRLLRGILSNLPAQANSPREAGCLCQWVVTAQQCFFLFRWNLPCFGLCPFASCPDIGHIWKESGSVLFVPYLSIFVYIDKIHPEPPIIVQAKQSQVSEFYLTEEMLNSFNHAIGPLLDSQLVLHISCTEKPRTEYLCVLTCVEGKDHPPWPSGNTFPRSPLDCYAAKGMFNFVSTRTHRNLYAKLLSSWAAPSIYWCKRCSSSHSSSCWTSWCSCQPISAAWQGSSGWQHNSLVYQPLLRVLCHQQPAEVALCSFIQITAGQNWTQLASVAHHYLMASN